MTLDAFALTSLADVKNHLNIGPSITTQDAVLIRIINAASAQIESYIDRKVLKRAYNEFQDGRNNDRTITRQWPIEKPTQVWDDPSGLFTNATNQLAVSEYEVEGDPAIGIVLIGGRRFSKSTRNVRIVYQAGFDVVPYEISEACIWTVEFLYDMRSDRRIGVSSKGKNAESTTFLGDLPEVVKNMLLPYQRVEFALANVAVQNF